MTYFYVGSVCFFLGQLTMIGRHMVGCWNPPKTGHRIDVSIEGDAHALARKVKTKDTGKVSYP